MQVYLPDELYRAVKSLDLPASELLQKAVRAELDRNQILEETDRYIADLIAKVGQPSAADFAKAEALARKIQRNDAPAQAS
jgi:post-segregation antitoxin (ccd killing protein)